MTKKIFFCALLILAAAVPLLYGQQYSVTIETLFTVKYSGDYTGELTVNYLPGESISRQTFTIGPYSQPFTVTLEQANPYEIQTYCYGRDAVALDGYTLVNWDIEVATTIDGVATVTVDSTQPNITAIANWQMYLTGDWWHPRSGSIVWTTRHVVTGEVNSTFNFGLETHDCHSLLQVYDLDINYNPDVLRLESIDLSSYFETASIDLSTTGRIGISGSFPEGLPITMARNIAVLSWTILQDYSSSIDITINTYNYVEGSGTGIFTEGTLINPDSPSPPDSPGDVDGNGTVDIVDALKVARYDVGIDVAGFITANGDVNGNGVIDIVDALMIARCYVGLIRL